jgi:streptogramin lyase
MLHKLFAHISPQPPKSGSRPRLHTALLLTLAVLLGLSFSGIANANSIQNTDKSSSSAAPAGQHAAVSQHAQPMHFHPNITGAEFLSYQQTLPFINGRAVAINTDSNGNIYVADFTTGNVYEEAPIATGGYTQTLLFTTIANGPTSLAIDSNGNIFVTTFGNQLVYEGVLSGGTYTATTIGSGFSLPYGVAVDYLNNVYIADPGTATVYELVPGSSGYTQNSLITNLSFPTDVAVDQNLNLYITNDGTPYELVLETYEGAGNPYVASTLGSGWSAPAEVAVSPNHTVYVGDQSTNTLNELVPNGAGGYDQSVVSSAFGAIRQISLDSLGNIYVADDNLGIDEADYELSNNFGYVSVGVGSSNNSNHQVVANFDVQSGTVIGGTLALTQGTQSVDFYDTGTGTCTTGTYGATTTCSVVLSFAPSMPGLRNGSVTLVDGVGNALTPPAYVEGIGVAPLINFPPGTLGQVNSFNLSEIFSTAEDANGDIFATDVDTDSVWEYSPSGTWTNIATGFDFPTGLAVDGGGNVYVATDNGINELTPGISGYTNTQIITSSNNFGTLYNVLGIAVDANGNLYFTSYGGQTAFEAVSLGGGSYDVNPIAGGFAGLTGVAVDSFGNVYVNDFNAGNVYQLVPSITGFTKNLFVTDLDTPESLSIDDNNNIYIFDSGDDTGTSVIYKETLASGSYTQSVYYSSNYNQGGPYIWWGSLDSSGNAYLTDDRSPSTLSKLDVVTPPVEDFLTTPLNQVSTDSPRYITLANVGNQPLDIYIPGSGNNPSISTNFLLNSTAPSACPVVSSTSANLSIVEYDTACQLDVSFEPTVVGSIGGTLTITDNNLGNLYAGSGTSVTQTIFLNGTGLPLATPAVSLVSSANPSLVGNPVTLVASVVGDTNYVPAGTVNFYDGATLIGSGTLTSGGVSLTLPSLAVGSHSITAAYTGSTVYAAATSTALVEVIEDFSLTFNITGNVPPTVKAGQALTLNLTVAPVSPATTIPTAITLTAAGGPVNTTYAFSPTSIPAGAGSTSVTLTITVPVSFEAMNDAPQQPGQNNRTKLPVAPLALALMLLPLAGRLRKAGKRMSRMIAMVLLAIAGITATATLIGCGSNSAVAFDIVVTASGGADSHSSTAAITVEGN